ncbi:MAG: dTDP-4-dehydrorhamnose 3,5-epimerase [Chloroflexi bacterium]|nr:dTDP-4-dehydrorhamnose 3,5-epimerase [Chloroflexota bacterium]
MPFQFRDLEIADVILIEPRQFGDDRGVFMETYRASEFQENGMDMSFVQDNYSRSRQRVLRGLHYQKSPQAQGKLVSVVRGEVFDVAVDIRRGSPTYGEWVGEVLSDANRHMLYIPPGFAHGFYVLSHEADFVYKVTAEYSAALDRGIRWDDPEIGISWPCDGVPLLSPKDSQLPLLRDADNNFEYAVPETYSLRDIQTSGDSHRRD